MKSKELEWLSSIAESISMRSKDPSTKVGCVIFDKNLRIVSCGYNGFVKGCQESLMTFDRPLKYHLTIHAEMNAILFAKEDLSGCSAFITHGPCENCLKHLLQKGISKIIFKEVGPVKDRWSEDQKEAIRRLILACGAHVTDMNGNKYIDLIF